MRVDAHTLLIIQDYECRENTIQLIRRNFLLFLKNVVLHAICDLLYVDPLCSIYDNIYGTLWGDLMTLLHVFSANVKQYRKRKNISQEKLAELAGLHRTYISALERERRNISIDNIQRIAEALEIDAYLLFVDKME